MATAWPSVQDRRRARCHRVPGMRRRARCRALLHIRSALCARRIHKERANIVGLAALGTMPQPAADSRDSPVHCHLPHHQQEDQSLVSDTRRELAKRPYGSMGGVGNNELGKRGPPQLWHPLGHKQPSVRPRAWRAQNRPPELIKQFGDFRKRCKSESWYRANHHHPRADAAPKRCVAEAVRRPPHPTAAHQKLRPCRRGVSTSPRRHRVPQRATSLRRLRERSLPSPVPPARPHPEG